MGRQAPVFQKQLFHWTNCTINQNKQTSEYKYNSERVVSHKDDIHLELDNKCGLTWECKGEYHNFKVSVAFLQ